MTPESWAKCTASIKRHEGYRQLRYLDSTGNPTIGYGHKITSSNTSLQSLTLEQASDLLNIDMRAVEQELIAHLPLYVTLDDPRQAVILEMCFNLGLAGLMGFRATLSAVAAQDYALASKDMLASLWAKQVHGRANDLAYTMESGVL